MGKAFDAAKNDDSFYLPPEIFNNEDFKRVMDIFMSPDGKSARMLISQRGDPATPEGIARVDPIKTRPKRRSKARRWKTAKSPRRHRGDGERPRRGIHIRSLDRGRRRTLPHFHHHADHDAKLCRRPGHRRHGGDFDGRVLRVVHSRLAASSRHPNTLGGAGDVRDRPLGGRVRLQPAVGIADERGNRRGHQHGHHPGDGRYRAGS